jgi:hypothetical protein
LIGRHVDAATRDPFSAESQAVTGIAGQRLLEIKA